MARTGYELMQNMNIDEMTDSIFNILELMMNIEFLDEYTARTIIREILESEEEEGGDE